jgi:hypothetical protein
VVELEDVYFCTFESSFILVTRNVKIDLTPCTLTSKFDIKVTHPSKWPYKGNISLFEVDLQEGSKYHHNFRNDCWEYGYAFFIKTLI